MIMVTLTEEHNKKVLSVVYKNGANTQILILKIDIIYQKYEM